MSGDSRRAPNLARGLAGYVRAVAGAVGVPVEATSSEISDTASAYLGLTRKWTARPGADLMLVWNERRGWAVEVETDVGEAPQVVAYLVDEDVVPEPGAVARFVTDVVAGRRSGSRELDAPVAAGRQELAERLSRYA